MAELKILSYNVQGLGGISKRTDVLDFLKNTNFDIFCLQDTHFTHTEEKLILNLWNGECLFNNYRSNARGVAILFGKNIEYKVHQKITDNEGNILAIDITAQSQRFTLINIYGPNADSPSFFHRIFQYIEEIGNNDFIICGDFNLVLNPCIDCSDYKNINNPKARKVLLEYIEMNNVIDPFREIQPQLKRYTWRKRNPLKQARLDFFLTSEGINQYTEHSKVGTSYRSDHSLITLEFRFNDIFHGKSYWKHNNSLLTDLDYLKAMNKKITEVKIQYAIPVYNIDEIEKIPDEELQFTINDQMFLDVLLMELRGQSISYASYKNKQKNNLEKELTNRITRLENNLNDNKITELDILKTELYELRQEKLKGNLVRSRADYIDKGERPTKYFCGLEKHNYIAKSMQQLQKDDGTILTDQEAILKETELFYKTLYSSRETDLETINLNEYVGHNMKKVTNEQANKLEGLLTLNEISDTLRNMKNGKSPGLSGFSAEFFKVFWGQLRIFILRSLNCGYKTGELSITQKQGIITCIPKDNKPKIFLKNWRPLTLLDTIYKLASGAIASRLKTVLDSIINKDQTGFIKGRSIVENIRVIYDVMKFTEEQHIPGLLLLIDFEKAFDSLSWNFLNNALEHLNFGESIRKWVKIFYKNITSAVILSGHLSSFFNIERGCRQGDPLSPYLFVICAEFLATKMRKNDKIKGLNMGNIEFKISQYADDTSAILDGTETSLNQTLEELLKFSKISGLNINLDKTQLVWIGSEKFSTRSIKTKWKLLWGSNKFKLLGIHFNTDLEKMEKENYTPKIQQMEKILKQWNKRTLSPIGKITVIKTLVIPIYNHLFMSLPNPDDVIIERINKILYDFLWNNNPKIKKSVIVKQYTEGGLKMINLNAFVNALKSTWIRRLLLKENKWQEFIRLHIKLEKLTSCNVEYIRDIYNTINNQFWKDVLKAFLEINCKMEIDEEHVLKSPIFCNKNIKVGRNHIFYKTWYDKGIRFVNDLVNDNGNFKNYQEIKITTGTFGNFLEYQGVIDSLKHYLKKLNMSLKGKLEYPFIPSHIQIFLQQKSGAQAMYNMLNKNLEQPTGKKTWNEKFNFTDQDWKNIYKYPFNIITYPAIQWFQTSINHNILVTNALLVKMKLKDDSHCYYCQCEEETITHLFWSCDKIQFFLDKLLQWLKNNGIHCSILKEFFLFGLDRNNIIPKTINVILLYAKYFIYITKCNQRQLLLDVFKKKLLIFYKTLMEIALSKDQLTEFRKDWDPYQTLLNDID